MKWKKASEELVEFLVQKMKNLNCDYRKMFGYPAYFINGNMFAGLFGDSLFLRFSKPEREEILKTNSEAKHFEPINGRTMKEYVVIPKSTYSSDRQFNIWLNRSVKYASELLSKKENDVFTQDNDKFSTSFY
jgi:TfoX/Sxy family transcriptional regulator of competence genes